MTYYCHDALDDINDRDDLNNLIMKVASQMIYRMVYFIVKGFAEKYDLLLPKCRFSFISWRHIQVGADACWQLCRDGACLLEATPVQAGYWMLDTGCPPPYSPNLCQLFTAEASTSIVSTGYE